MEDILKTFQSNMGISNKSNTNQWYISLVSKDHNNATGYRTTTDQCMPKHLNDIHIETFVNHNNLTSLDLISCAYDITNLFKSFSKLLQYLVTKNGSLKLCCGL